MLSDERRELPDQMRVAPACEVRFDPVLERLHPELVEPCDLALGKLGKRELGKCGASPQRERLSQSFCRVFGFPVVERTPALVEQPLEQ